MKAILIDDEYYALQGLKIELEKINVKVVGIYEDGEEALKSIDKINPDVVFLDIEMPGINGLDLYEKILDINNDMKVVFVTAFNEYAVKAFELNAVDYLVKPVQRERLLKTIQRIEPRDDKKVNLRVNCFKNFSLILNEKVINVDWRTKKAEELIAYLACEKGNFVSKSKLAEELWPKLDGEKGINNVYLAYYYIKKQQKKLEIIIPIESKRGKMRLNIEEISLDIEEFDKCLAKCEKFNNENIMIAEEAIDLYKGMILAENYYSWTSTIQQKYYTAYLNLLIKMLDFYKKNKQFMKYNKYKIYLEDKIS